MDQKALKAKEKQLKEREKTLAEAERSLASKKANLTRRENALAGKEAAAADAPKAGQPEKKELSPAHAKLIDAACKAYGIPRQYVLTAGFDALRDKAVVVTHGGAKVFYGAGDEVAELSQIAITGVNPEAKKRKPVAGKKR